LPYSSSFIGRNVVSTWSHLESSSVATLLLWKSTRFHVKKYWIHKKTLDYKSKLTHSENAQKMRCYANHRHCATHCKPETRKTRDSSNACVCLCRWLKVL